ncbi:hypothetical protein HPC49_14850 [Pyxidicoccus fallax]|uniref:Glycosyl transferase family 28 C-terminal domain-containing protein n=1 Tax=Pyxidicoccus fallax TaxID=394095 RepID=A0A848LJW9_9BACT|nr:hypothetical protein [Pyxidicoccus fallax]NMO18002.1 hypothetical protein [Pyxidicoccus fallax]NPC79511.1 hypothetical protein [Pyxidicoccus fallax]
MAALRWLVYALGGGMGHLTRACALARLAARRGHAVTLLTNSPFAPGLPLDAVLGPGVTVWRPGATLDKQGVREAVARWLDAERPDVFVVDTFPRGLGGELAPLLPGLRARKVLIHRDLNPAYVERFDVARAVDAFDLLLVPGEDAPFAGHPRAVRTAPWLLLEEGELLSRAEARGRLGVAAEEARPVVAVMGCGTPAEVEEAGDIAARLQSRLEGSAVVRWLVPPGAREPRAPASDEGLPSRSVRATALPAPPHPSDALLATVWPALAVLPGVDVLVGAGGYNTVHEARATGTPLMALARARLYDRQALRLRAEERADSVEAWVERAVQLALARPGRGPGPYVSGTRDAVARIERLLLSA